MELQYLRDILEDLRCRFELKYSPNEVKLKRQLLVLKSMEKQLIRKKVLEIEYNSSLNVLKILQETGVVSITDYLENTKDDGVVQGIIADIFDTPDSENILAELITSPSEVIAPQFDECFKQYVSDLIHRPETVKNEFVCKMERHIPMEIFRDKIALNFFNELLRNYQHYDDITMVISQQKDWNLQYGEQRLLTQIINCIFANHTEIVFNEIILKYLHSDSRINWYFLLFIIKHVQASSKRIIEQLKTMLKKVMKKFHDTDCVDHLYFSMLVARQLFHYHPSPETTYKAWVKSTIGEMHYHLKDNTKFSRAIECLSGLIFYETDVDILEIHSQTSISSMRGTNHLILEYKQQLRTRIAALTEPEIVMDLT